MVKVRNVEMLGLESSIVASAYPALKRAYNEEEFKQKKKEVHNILFNDDIEEQTDWATKRVNRAKLLGSVPQGTAHDNFLKGIVVQFDITYPVYWSPQFQRYHFADIVSSTSSMYTLTKIDLNESMNEFTIPELKLKLQDMIYIYNEALSKGHKTVIKRTIKEEYTHDIVFFLTTDYNLKECVGKMKIIEEEIPIEDLYMYIISNCPQGLEKTMRVSTNYLQLKTMYLQRKNHKLYDWKEFVKWIETLPYFKELTGVE